MAEIKEVLRDLNHWWKEEFRVEFKERGIYKLDLRLECLHLFQQGLNEHLHRFGRLSPVFRGDESLKVHWLDLRIAKFYTISILHEIYAIVKGKFAPHLNGYYKQIQKFLPLPQIVALTGLHRVGKTTLMHKIIEDAIKNGFDPRNIMYFSFDEFREVEIREVLHTYEDLMEKNLRRGKYSLFLDELQKLINWEDQLKAIYDTFGKNLKIVISGSESLFIRKKSKETLAGRIFEFKIEPLSFKEFLLFKGVEFKPIGLYEKELVKLFEEFILTLGFPELVGIKDKEVIKKYIKESIVEKIVYRDIPKLFKVRDISIIESIINILMEEPGQLIEISDLAKELKISRQTLSNYLSYLEESFLIRKLYNFSRSRRKVERKLRKYYPAIISVELLFKEDSSSKSHVFEWLTVTQLKAEFFWRDPYKNEVDIVLIEKNPMPLEVKYGKIDYKGLLVFMKKFNVNEGCIISYNKEEKQKLNGKTIYVIPAFKYLLYGIRP